MVHILLKEFEYIPPYNKSSNDSISNTLETVRVQSWDTHEKTEAGGALNKKDKRRQGANRKQL